MNHPPHFSLSSLIRPNILSLKPYRCARDDYQTGILLDANENSIGPSLPQQDQNQNQETTSSTSSTTSSLTEAQTDSLSLHRYPDPSLFNLKDRLSSLRNISTDRIFLGVGSDEVLDLIQRIAANPGKDSICVCPPTYGMYSVGAAVNDLNVVKVPQIVQGGDFSLDLEKLNQTLSTDPSIKILFLCSPGNPTGSLIPLEQIVQILENPSFKGLVVVDEAYIDFAIEEIKLSKGGSNEMRNIGNGKVSAVELVEKYSNLIVTQTLSKAFGLAGIRLGMAFSQPELIQIMNNTKAPYNISTPTAYLSSTSLSPQGLLKMKQNIKTLLENRISLMKDLKNLDSCGEIKGSNHSNFVLVEILDKPKDKGGKPDSKRSQYLYKNMAENFGVVVRNRSSEWGCDGCLRITVGTENENLELIRLMKQMLEEKWGN